MKWDTETWLSLLLVFIVGLILGHLLPRYYSNVPGVLKEDTTKTVDDIVRQIRNI